MTYLASSSSVLMALSVVYDLLRSLRLEPQQSGPGAQLSAPVEGLAQPPAKGQYWPVYMLALRGVYPQDVIMQSKLKPPSSSTEFWAYVQIELVSNKTSILRAWINLPPYFHVRDMEEGVSVL